MREVKMDEATNKSKADGTDQTTDSAVADAALAESAAADALVLAASRRSTRRSFTAAALAAAAGYGVYRLIDYGPDVDGQPWARRKMYQAEAALSRALFHDRALAPTYPVSRSEMLRVNGRIGLKQDLLADSWRLQLVGAENPTHSPYFSNDVTAWEYAYDTPNRNDDPDSINDLKYAEDPKVYRPHRERAGKTERGLEEAGRSFTTLPSGTPGLLLPLTEITRLPRHELVTQFKCIEGWSQIVHWGGVRMADFLNAYPPARKPDGSYPRYVYMETPNGDYYVGYDLHVCRHPQTLLVTEMAGKPLTQIHGAPLRLHAPTKYGYKQIKRIGLIAYTDTKPDDYWTKLGYDWYAGL
jgi:hypothetical protein